MRSTLRYSSLSSLFALVILLGGCPNPEARFQDFLDVTAHNRTTGADGMDGGMDSGMVVGLEDMTGYYLFALEVFALGPGLPLQFGVEIANMSFDMDGMGAVADFTFTPLSVAQECLTETLSFDDVEFDADGKFEIDMGLVMVSGAANPITGSDIEATLVVSGQIIHSDGFCGDIDGDLVNPLVYPLAGSTFAAIRLADDACVVELPSSFPWSCAMLPPAP